MPSRRAPEPGFSLPELLATLAVAGVTLSLALPGLTRITGDNQRAQSINDLAGALHLARSTAITRNSRVTVCATRDGERCGGPGWESGWLVFVDEDADHAADGGEQRLAQGPGLPGMTVRSDEFPLSIGFRPTGHVETPGGAVAGQFTFCDRRGPASARVLAVSVAGQPRLLDPPLDAPPPDCPDEAGS